MEKVDQDYLDEILKSQGQAKGDTKPNEKSQEDHVTYEEIQQMAAKLGKGDFKYDMDLIIKFLQVYYLLSSIYVCTYIVRERKKIVL